MRLFVSIPLPEECVDYLSKIQKQLGALALFEGSIVPPANLHITLVFFGSVSNEELETIKRELSTISYRAFPIQLGPLGVNSHSHPHVIWATLDAPFLEPLAQLIAEKLPQFKQDRAFNGHITIARMKHVISKKELFAKLDSLTIAPLSWEAKTFELIASDTLPEGPVYTVVTTFPLFG